MQTICTETAQGALERVTRPHSNRVKELTMSTDAYSGHRAQQLNVTRRRRKQIGRTGGLEASVPGKL